MSTQTGPNPPASAYPAFGGAPQAESIVRQIAELIAVEQQVVDALDAQAVVAAAHPEAGAAIARFRAIAASQREVLREQFQLVGGSDAHLRDVTGEVRPTVLAMRRAAEAGERPITTMLAADYTAFCDLALTYGLLWVSGHRAQAASAERPTYRIGENHQNAYAGAAQEIVKLVVDVLGWELDQADEPCRCYCACCSGLGMCVCLGGGRDLIVSAWADTAVAPEQGTVVRTLRAGGPAAQAGLQAGDVVVRIGEEEVSDVWKFNPSLRAALQAAPAGQPLAMHVRRGEDELSLTLSPPAR